MATRVAISKSERQLFDDRSLQLESGGAHLAEEQAHHADGEGGGLPAEERVPERGEALQDAPGLGQAGGPGPAPPGPGPGLERGPDLARLVCKSTSATR